MTSPLVFLIGIRKEENCLSLTGPFFNYITGGAIAPAGTGFGPPVAIILPPENLQIWFPVNTSKATKELFSSNHAIFLFLSA